MHVGGITEAAVTVDWETVTPQMQRGYADPQEATEFGAAAVAILLTKDLVGFSVIRRSRKGTGFDYWLGDEQDDPDLYFNHKARLEVSGIRHGTSSAINSRLQEKKDQTKRSDATGLPAYISIVEFGKPFALLVKR